MAIVEFHGVANNWRAALDATINDSVLAVVLAPPAAANPETPFKFSIGTERVICTAAAADTPTAGKTTYTITRAADGTSAASHTAGVVAKQFAGAAEITELQTNLRAGLGIAAALSGGGSDYIIRNPLVACKVQQQGTPDLTMLVSAGSGFIGDQPFTLYADFTTAAVVAPSGNDRIDTVQVSSVGVVTIKTGVEDASPVAPTVDADNLLLATVLLTTAHTDVQTADLTDGRAFA